MSISPTSAALSGLDTATKISTAVARKTLDAQKQQGDAAVALIKSAAEVARVSNTSKAPATLGNSAGRLDVEA